MTQGLVRNKIKKTYFLTSFWIKWDLYSHIFFILSRTSTVILVKMLVKFGLAGLTVDVGTPTNIQIFINIQTFYKITLLAQVNPV